MEKKIIMKTWYDEEQKALFKKFNELCEKSACHGVVFSKSRRAGVTGLWHTIMLDSQKAEPSVTDYMKAIKRAMGKKEKPVYNSALREALNKPSWR